GPCGVSFRPVEELADQAALERVQQGTAGPPLHRRVDVLLDPLHEVLRTEADDVRLFRPLDHPLSTSVPHAAGRSWSTRISGSLLTLRPRMFTTVSPPGFRPISATKMYPRSALKIGSVRLTSAFATRARPRRPTTGHRRTGHRDSGGPAGRMRPGEAHGKLDELRDPVPRDNRILHEAPGLAGSGTLDDRRKDGPAEFPECGLSVRVLGDLGGATQLVSSGDWPDHVGDDRIEIALVEFDEEHGRGAGRYAVD